MTEDGAEIEEGGFEAALVDAPGLVAALAADMLADASPGLRALFSAG
jgi:hydroxymethylbilane synthase